MSVPQASSRGARSPGRRRSPRRRTAVPLAGFPAVPLVGFPGSVPQACQSIQDEIDGVLADLNDLQFQLKHAAPEDKPAIQADIRKDNKKVATLRAQLAECIASQPNVPPPTEAYFIGTSELTTTNESAPGPFFDNLAFRLNIGGDPARITIETFPQLGAVFDTPLGPGTTTVTSSAAEREATTRAKSPCQSPCISHRLSTLACTISLIAPTSASCCRPTRRRARP